MVKILQDMQSTLEFAKNWYKQQPDTQIPLQHWDDLLAEKAPAIDGVFYEFRVLEGERSVRNFSAKAIPALAGISLGLKTSQLHAIALHHRIDLLELSRWKFGYVYKPASEEKPVEFTQWNATKHMMRAFHHDPGTSHVFLESVSGKALSPTQEIASLTIPRPSVWPVSGIVGHIQCARAQREPHRSQPPPLTSAEAFSQARIDLAHLSDDQAFQLLERSGNLTLGATSEHGLATTFFEDFVGFLLDNYTNCIHLVDVLNKLTDAKAIETVRLCMLEQLSDVQPDGHEWTGEWLLEGLEKHFDHNKFGRLHDDMILKLNVANVKKIEGIAQVKNGAIPDCIKEFFCQGELVMLRLYQTLAPVMPSQYKNAHFRALKVASTDWDKEQDLSSVDLSALLLKSLEAYDAYRLQNHVDLMGAPQVTSKQNARYHMTCFARYALKHISHDHALFAGISSEAKAILASAGMDIKKLPGISQRDKGRVLCDQLGI
jgi:hypothetical protein